jgi:hypothetical protein
MSKLKIFLIILLLVFFVGSIALTWYIASQRRIEAETAVTSTSTTTTTDRAVSDTGPTSTSESEEIVNLILQPGYNLKTIPYILSPNDGKTVFLNLSSQEVDVLEGGEWKDILADSQTVSPGQGMVIYSKEGEVYTLPVSASELDQTKPFTIRLTQGWNAIGNPFTRDVKWNPVIRTSKGSTTLDKAITANILSKAYYYDTAGKEYREMATDATWKTFQGLLIKAGGAFDLIIDPTLTP